MKLLSKWTMEKFVNTWKPVVNTLGLRRLQKGFLATISQLTRNFLNMVTEIYMIQFTQVFQKISKLATSKKSRIWNSNLKIKENRYHHKLIIKKEQIRSLRNRKITNNLLLYKAWIKTISSMMMLLTFRALKESWKRHRTTSLFIITTRVLGPWPVLLFLLWFLGPGLWFSWFSLFIITTRRFWWWTWGTWVRRSPPWMLQRKDFESEDLTITVIFVKKIINI